jgi:iron complex outermembrane receptor protein
MLNFKITMMRKIIFFSLFNILLINQILSGQNQIRGKITDHNKKPLPGATVFVPELTKGAVSDNDGNYVLNDLPNGRIKIQLSFVGYNNEIITVHLSGTPINLSVTLKEIPIETEAIVISGGYNSSQHENAVKIDILNLNHPYNINTPNFSEALTKVPGVDMISKGIGVSKPVVRGLSMDNVLVLNNGVRNENYQYSDHHPLGIDEFGIEEAEVIKGPASLLYGSDAIGGVINFIKEKPAPVGSIIGDYNLQLFSNSLGITNNIVIKGAGKNFFGGFRFGRKSNADYIQGGGDYVRNSRFYEISFKANAGFTNKNGMLKLYYDYKCHKLGLPEEEAGIVISERGRKNKIWYQQFNNHLI